MKALLLVLVLLTAACAKSNKSLNDSASVSSIQGLMWHRTDMPNGDTYYDQIEMSGSNLDIKRYWYPIAQPDRVYYVFRIGTFSRRGNAIIHDYCDENTGCHKSATYEVRGNEIFLSAQEGFIPFSNNAVPNDIQLRVANNHVVYDVGYSLNIAPLNVWPESFINP